MSSIAIAADHIRTPSKARVLGILRPFDAVAAVSLWAMFMLRHGTYWNAITTVAVIVAFNRSVRRSGWFWLSLSALLAVPVCLQWHAYEDHMYFGVCWIAAIGISRFGVHKRRSLMVAGRTLIVLAMALAVLWKAIGGQYMSSEMFHHKLLTDPRFCTLVTQPIAGVSDSAVAANRTAILGLRKMDGEHTVQLSSTPSLGLLSVFVTYWTILIELLIAACFALPRIRLLDRMRNPSLLLFMVSTYVIVPVIGFGLLFATMAMAQCRRDERHWQLSYFMFAGLLCIYAGLGYDYLV